MLHQYVRFKSIDKRNENLYHCSVKYLLSGKTETWDLFEAAQNKPGAKNVYKSN